MKWIVPGLVIWSSLCFPGCSYLCIKKPAEPQAIPFVRHGKIIQKDRLAEGGRLLIVPFNAGEGAAASDELDRLSLLIVKGISSVLGDGQSSFFLVFAGEADTADRLIQGHVVRMGTEGGWIFWKRKKFIGVEGQLIDRTDHRVILEFSHYRETVQKDQPLDSLALLIGEVIGRFLKGELKTE